MTTIPLTRKQLEQLTEEYQKLENWTTVRDFCTQVYGPNKAVKAELESYGEYNDEGGTDYRINDITAYDTDGNELAFDLSLPFWQYLLKEEEETEEENEIFSQDPQDKALDALKDWYPWGEEAKALIEQHNWIEFHNLPCDVHEGGDATYDLTQEPKISFPVVVAVE